MVKFPTGLVDVRFVNLGSDTLLLKIVSQFLALVVQCIVIIILVVDGNDYNLILCNLGRQNQSLVVSVHHDHGTDTSCGESPGSLMNMFLLFMLVLKLNIEHLGEVLAKMVTGGSLNTSTVSRDIELNGVCVYGSSKSLFL